MSGEDIFRFVSFFDLYTLLKDKRLRMSQATRFNDKNEGYGFVLDELEKRFTLLPRRFFPDVNITGKSASSYISCWTKNPSSAAMWSLYSKDSDSFLIQTTREKLSAALKNYVRIYPTQPHKLCEFSPDGYVDVIDVTYIDYSETKREIETRNTDVQQAIKQLRAKGLPRREEIREEFALVGKMVNIFIWEHPWSYKDRAYDFENEVRAIIEFSPSNEHAGIENEEDILQFSSDIRIEIDDEFIEDIQIDGRCAAFKRDVFYDILKKYGHKMRESNIFSSLEQ